MKNKILITILIILVVGLGGYLLYDKVLKENITGSTVDKNNNTDVVAFDLSEAEKVIKPYLYADDYYNSFSNTYNESYQKELAFLSVDKNKWGKIDCKAIYENKDGYIYDESGKAYIGQDDFGCYGGNSVSYEVLNASYKKMFGKDLERKTFEYHFSKYDYQNNDTFVLLSRDGGFFDQTIYLYGIYSANKKGNDLTVTMVYSELGYEYVENGEGSYITTINNEGLTWKESGVIDKEKFKKDFLAKYKEKMDKYEFNFVYDIDHYYLKSVNKILY